MARGLFVVFEGGEGTGKTTQIKKLEAQLKAQGYPVYVTFEPGGTALGSKLRELLLNPEHKPVDPYAELLMMAAARAQHVDQVLLPKLAEGCIVLCDRYWDASRAYQGVARQLGLAAVDQINQVATRGLYPDRVYLFDLEGEGGLARARERAQSQSIQLDRMEQEGQSFHQQVRQGYLYLAQHNPRMKVLDASLAIDPLFATLWDDFQKLLPKKP